MASKRPETRRVRDQRIRALLRAVLASLDVAGEQSRAFADEIFWLRRCLWLLSRAA